MGSNNEREAIERRFAANFTALPVEYENVRFSPPTNSPYVRLTIRNGESFQASTGDTPMSRNSGVVIVDVFVPESTGTATARAHADTVAGVFRRAQFSAGTNEIVSMRTPTIRPIGTLDGWYQISVATPYKRDEFV